MMSMDPVSAGGFAAAAGHYARARPVYARAVVGAIAQEVRRSRVLDLGAGTGILTGQLRRAGCDVVGLEPLGGMVEQFRRALHAWSSQDLELAEELARSGAVLDLANSALVRALLELEGPSAIPAALHSLVIGKALDRIADHSAIIGSRLRYLLTGDPGHLAAEIR